MEDSFDNKQEGIKADFKQGELQFKNVNFAYPDQKPIFKNLSFTVEDGQSVAIVGPTGAGKSTIMRLIYRFYDVNGGSIEIDGNNISKMDVA